MKHFFRFASSMVFFFTNNLFDTSINDHLCANCTRCHFTIKGGTINGDPYLCGLNNRILFGVSSADAVLALVTIFVNGGFHLVADFITVGHTFWRSNVAGNKDLFVFGDDTATSSTITRGAFCNSTCHLHEVFIPGRSNVFFYGCLSRHIAFKYIYSLAEKSSSAKCYLSTKNLPFKGGFRSSIFLTL